MRRAAPFAAFVGLALSSLTPVQAASVYKWIDAKGVVHYDDTYVVGRPLTQATLDRRVIAPRATLKVPRDFADEVKRLCAVQRDRLASFRSATAMYGRDPVGNVYPLSPAQMRLTVLETERDTQHYCAQNAADTLYAERVAAARQAADEEATRKTVRR